MTNIYSKPVAIEIDPSECEIEGLHVNVNCDVTIGETSLDLSEIVDLSYEEAEPIAPFTITLRPDQLWELPGLAPFVEKVREAEEQAEQLDRLSEIEIERDQLRADRDRLAAILDESSKTVAMYANDLFDLRKRLIAFENWLANRPTRVCEPSKETRLLQLENWAAHRPK